MSMSLQSQAAVDSFQDIYGPCDQVLTLYVEGADITNLDGLSALTGAGSSLYIQNNPVLNNIAGLSALTSVTRNLWIQNNDSLTSLDGLSALTWVGHLLAIFQNDALTHIDGLATLPVIGGSLVIRDNNQLTDVDGLSSLTGIAGSDMADQRFLHIENNAALTNLDGLSSVTRVGIQASGNAVVLINNNPALDNCKGMLRLLDTWDDAEPGPGGGAVPDVAGEVIMGGNLAGCNSIGEILGSTNASRLNAGLNDAWYNPVTSGQGFFITHIPRPRRGVPGLVYLRYRVAAGRCDRQSR